MDNVIPLRLTIRGIVGSKRFEAAVRWLNTVLASDEYSLFERGQAFFTLNYLYGQCHMGRHARDWIERQPHAGAKDISRIIKEVERWERRTDQGIKRLNIRKAMS